MTIGQLLRQLAWSAGTFKIESEGSEEHGSIRIVMGHGDGRVTSILRGDKMQAEGEDAVIERALTQLVEHVRNVPEPRMPRQAEVRQRPTPDLPWVSQ